MENPPADPSAQIEYIVTSLLAVKRMQSTRLQRGLALRQVLGKRLAAGEMPEHYRVQWLSSSVDRIMAVLGEVATEFNAAHPDDVASSADFIDILSSTINTLKIATGKIT